MGFRNPLTSLSADQITPGTLLGSVILTALTGKRIRITSTPTNRIEFYTGDPDETAPGVLDVAIHPGTFPTLDTPELTITPPELNGFPSPAVSFRGIARDGSGSQVLDVAGQVHVVGLTVNGTPYAQQTAWIYPRASTDSWAATAPATFTPVITSGALAWMPAGDYLVALTLVLAADANRTAWVRLIGPAQMPSLGDPRADLTTQLNPKSFTNVIQDHPGGPMSALTAYVQLSAGTGTIYAGGSRLSLVYLGQRT